MEKRTFRHKPPKRKSFDGVPVDFKRINSDFPSGLYYARSDGRYQSLYPSVYSIQIESRWSFTKVYDHFVEAYFEDRQLINYRQFSLYNYLATLRNRGYYLSLKGNGKRGDHEVLGLAQITGVSPRTLSADLDHLEDCMLIHRVRRLDLQGIPNEIVIHLPKTPPELDRGGYQDWIERRVRDKATRSRRDGARIAGATEEGLAYSYVNRRTDGHSFDYGAIYRAFGEHALRFADWALIWFEKNWHFLRDDKRAFDHDVRKDLETEMNNWGISGNDRRHQCYTAFGVFRKIYCPLDTELFA